MSSESHNSSYIAQPPIANTSLVRHIVGLINAFFHAIKHTLTPFKEKPETPCDPPAAVEMPDAKIVDQCEKLYENADEVRKYLEEKSRHAFTLIVFLTPLVISAFVYVIAHTSSNHLAQKISLALYAVSGISLILAFIATARAVSVQPRETLYLNAVIGDKSNPYKYQPDRYVRGLIYCASVNTAMNAHIAQFVKNAHFLTSFSVLVVCTSAIPLYYIFSSEESSAALVQMIEPIKVEQIGMEDIDKRLRDLSSAIETIGTPHLEFEKRLVFLEQEVNSALKKFTCEQGKVAGE